jgi:hypothetical protein
MGWKSVKMRKTKMLTASVIRTVALMMEAANTSETSVNYY